MFYVGQKVVCVDDSETDNMGKKELRKDDIYTVIWVGRHFHPDEMVERQCVRLAEVIRKPCEIDPDGSMPFRASRFRPVVERKTDISIFTEMLNPSHKVVEVV